MNKRRAHNKTKSTGRAKKVRAFVSVVTIRDPNHNLFNVGKMEYAVVHNRTFDCLATSAFVDSK